MRQSYFSEVSAAMLAAILGTAGTAALPTNASAQSWFDGSWDATLYAMASHPRTIALRVLVEDADSRVPLRQVEVRVTGSRQEMVRGRSRRRTLELRARTNSDGIAVFGLGWHKESQYESSIDDIEIVESISFRKRGYEFMEEVFSLANLVQNDRAWVELANRRGVHYFALELGTSFRFYGRERCSDEIFFRRVRDKRFEQVRRARSPDYLSQSNPQRECGPYLAIELEARLDPISVDRQGRRDTPSDEGHRGRESGDHGSTARGASSYPSGSLEPSRVIKAHSERIAALDVHPSRGLLITGTSSEIAYWDFDANRNGTYPYSGFALAFDSDGDYFAFGGNDRLARIARLRGGRLQTIGRVMRGHSSAVNCASFFSQEGHDYLVTGSRDGTVKIWSRHQRLQGSPSISRDNLCAVQDMVVTRDESHAISVGLGRTNIWSLSRSDFLRRVRTTPLSGTCVDVSADGRALVVGLREVVRVLRVSDLQTENTFSVEGRVQDLDVSSSGSLLVAATTSSVHLHRFPSGELIQRFFVDGEEFSCAAISPAEESLIAGTESGNLVIWDISAIEH